MVVAADGVHGVIARRLGLLRGWRRDALAVDLMEETPTAELRATDPDALWVGYGFPASAAGGPDSLTAGYAYVFPKRAHVNVGLGYLSSEYRTAYRGPAYALQQGLDRVALSATAFSKAASRSDCFTPFLIPVGGPIRRTGTARTLIAGDAGGFVNGFSAEGYLLRDGLWRPGGSVDHRDTRRKEAAPVWLPGSVEGRNRRGTRGIYRAAATFCSRTTAG